MFGAGSDLQITHDGSNSLITDAGTGDLVLRASNDIILTDVAGNDNMQDLMKVELYLFIMMVQTKLLQQPQA